MTSDLAALVKLLPPVTQQADYIWIDSYRERGGECNSSNVFWFLLVDFGKVFARNKVTKELSGFQAEINGKCEATQCQKVWLISGAKQ